MSNTGTPPQYASTFKRSVIEAEQLLLNFLTQNNHNYSSKQKKKKKKSTNKLPYSYIGYKNVNFDDSEGSRCEGVFQKRV